MRKQLITISLLLFIFISCSKDEDNYVITDVGHSYAGLILGSYIVYDVDSHHYNLPFLVDTLIQFQIKEVVDSKIIDLEGDEAYKIIRYRRDTSNLLWTLQDVWNAKLIASNYQKVEENIRFIKLVFPVRINKTWNGNLKNAIDAQDYEYTSVHQQEAVGSIGFDSVATVLQFEDINLVQERYYEEKFAVGVGMVYKKSVNISNAFDNNVGLWVPDVGDDVSYTVNTFVR